MYYQPVTGNMRKIAFLVLSVIGLLAVLAMPLSFAGAISCPAYTTKGNGYTFSVTVTGADGSCPSTYSAATAIHYLLSTGATQNPYTVTLTNCVGSCPPPKVTFQGWTLSGITTVCGGTQPACGSTITFTVDATVQAGEACNTLNVKANGGQPILILEAGSTGSPCSTTSSSTTTSTTTPSGVPEFPIAGSLGLLLVVGIAIPLLVAARKIRSPIRMP